MLTPSILASAMRVLLRPGPGERLSFALVAGGQKFGVRIADGEIDVQRGPADDPQVTLRGEPGPLAAVIVAGLEPGVSTGGALDPVDVEVEGDRAALERLRAIVVVPDRLRAPAAV